MKHSLLIIFICAMFTSASVSAQTVENVQYTRQDSMVVMKIMHDANTKQHLSDTLLYIAHQLKGIPYVAKTLEVNEQERLVVNLRQLDCTTYVENVLAIYLCLKEGKTRFEDFCEQLRRIRYDAGKVEYVSRLHYFSWWIESNSAENIVKEVSFASAPFTKTQTLDIHFMSQNSHLYPMLKGKPKLIEEITEMEKNLNGKIKRYIPKDSIDNSELLRSTIHDGDILAIVTNKAGLDISHIGFAVWKKDGLHLLNASQIHKKVVEEPKTLYDYMKTKPSQIGIRVVRVNR